MKYQGSEQLEKTSQSLPFWGRVLDNSTFNSLFTLFQMLQISAEKINNPEKCFGKQTEDM